MSERPAPRHDAHAITWTRAAYGTALLLTLSIGYFLLHLPVDVSENIIAFVSVEGLSLQTLLTRGGVIRPLGWLLFKGVLDGSFGHPFEGFRLLNTLSIAGILFFAVRVMQVRTAQSWSVAVLVLMLMIGIHPFHEAVRETAVNHHLIMPCLVLAAVSIAVSTHKSWSDWLAVLILLCALLLMEAGVLVWVAIAVAWITGLRGVTSRGMAICTALLVTYLIVRFFVFDFGAPPFGSRSTGFGFHIMEPPETRARFAAQPLLLFAYNIVAAGLTVLASEPRGGVFSFIAQIVHGPVGAGSVINVVTSTLTTAVLVWFVTQRWRVWRAREFTHDDRIFLIGLAVWAANAVICFSYLKDVIMTTGAMLYAVAVFPALSLFLEQLRRPAISFARAAVVGLLVATVSVGWTIRAALFFADVRFAAYVSQNSWVEVDEWIARQEPTPLNEAQRAVVRKWRREMLALPVPRAYLSPEWIERLDPH
jgi:hypothetical protein